MGITHATIAHHFVVEHRSHQVEPWFGMLLTNVCGALEGLPLVSEKRSQRRICLTSAAMLRDLSEMIDVQRSGELGQSLTELFDYLARNLGAAGHDLKCIQEAIGLLTDVLSMWQSDASFFPLRSHSFVEATKTVH